MGEINKQVRKFLDGELVERRLELCVRCPLNGEYVPVIGNCVKDRIREDGQRSGNSVRLHGEPSDFWHEISTTCQYAKGITSKPISGDLKDIVCSYQKSL